MAVHRKNCDPFVFFPEFAIESVPARYAVKASHDRRRADGQPPPKVHPSAAYRLSTGAKQRHVVPANEEKRRGRREWV